MMTPIISDVFDVFVLPLDIIKKVKPSKFCIHLNDLWSITKDKRYLICPYCEKTSSTTKIMSLDHILNRGTLFCKNCNSLFYISHINASSIFYAELQPIKKFIKVIK